MFKISPYRHKRHYLSNYIPWAMLVGEGLVLNKDGSLQKTFSYRGPDLQSSSASSVVNTIARLNNAVKRLGTGWGLFTDAIRTPSRNYPDTLIWPHPVPFLIDEERRSSFETEGAHFESNYYLTICYLPAEHRKIGMAERLFLERDQQSIKSDFSRIQETFLNEIDRLSALIRPNMKEFHALDSDETWSYLYSTVTDSAIGAPVSGAPVSGARARLKAPADSLFMADRLAVQHLAGGNYPVLGSKRLSVLSVYDFPDISFAEMLSDLHNMPYAFRWTTRYLPLDGKDSIRLIRERQRMWWQKIRSFKDQLIQSYGGQGSPFGNPEASAAADDAQGALEAAQQGSVSHGYYTSTITWLSDDVEQGREIGKAIDNAITGRGYICKHETLNAVEAWLGTIPGHIRANPRRFLMNSINALHQMPIGAIWSGPEKSSYLDGPPLIIAKTAGTTTFRMDSHIEDNGHKRIVGPTGSGKSVLLNFMCNQFRKYPNSRIIILDRKWGAYVPTHLCGGDHYTLSLDTDLPFQPLSDIDSDQEKSWAMDWFATLFHAQGETMDMEDRKALAKALDLLATRPQIERTMQALEAQTANEATRQKLAAFTASTYKKLFCGNTNPIADNDWICFETEQVMSAPTLVTPLLSLLFHKLEKLFDGRPTMVVLDEVWAALKLDLGQEKFAEWIKTARSKNVSIVFASQSLSDIQDSPVASTVFDNVDMTIYLPNSKAEDDRTRPFYEKEGLNDTQIRLIKEATPKQDYYLVTPKGSRLFELGLGPVSLAACGRTSLTDKKTAERILKETPAGSLPEDFAKTWFTACGMPEIAEVIKQWPR